MPRPALRSALSSRMTRACHCLMTRCLCSPKPGLPRSLSNIVQAFAANPPDPSPTDRRHSGACALSTLPDHPEHADRPCLRGRKGEPVLHDQARGNQRLCAGRLRLDGACRCAHAALASKHCHLRDRTRVRSLRACSLQHAPFRSGGGVARAQPSACVARRAVSASATSRLANDRANSRFPR
jgi:hypothetical protein